MNERIKQLGEQAMTATTNKFSADREWSADEWRDFYDKKFAELIVLECASVSKKWFSNNKEYSADLAIKQHFGVEE